MALVLSLIFGVIWLATIFLVPPPTELTKEQWLPVTAFLAPLTLATYLLSITLLESWRRGMLVAVGVLILAVLQLIRLLNLFNLGLVLFTLTLVDRYFSESS